ncbi:beta-N-acetylhexosaminidase [Vallitalea okinawensis]|uniref:beta-N-acetylhexosaminidase n=1 Tax=Vallitalea okinawensis TaxID=2078660 RepID=UPI001FA89E58|nr:beta-N-acetylhexosaminidase [Vallitalea okinawensis]
MNLTLREKVGQRLVVGISGTTIDHVTEELISKYKIANIILFKNNIESNNQLKELCENLQRLVKKHTGRGAFITIDQEGGMVTRLAEDAVNMPGAMAIAAIGNPKNAYEAGKITGGQLKSLGVNFNLAPVVDINSNRDNPVIGVRSYGDCPENVAEYTVATTRGLLEGGVLASAKHFPGHGDTNVDSHLGLPQINKTLEELEKCELVPFQKVIEANIPAIMSAHILFPEIEKEQIPATMSREIITGLLKEKMGYKGLVVSDCMEMQAIKKYYGTVEGVKRAIMAGVDLVFISHTAELAREASDVLVNALECGELSMEEMDASIGKIFAWKEYYADHFDTEIGFDVDKGKELAYQLLQQSITPVKMPSKTLPELGSNPLFLGSIPFRATNVSNNNGDSFNFAEYMAKKFGGKGIITSPEPTQEEIDEVLKGADHHSSIMIGTYNGHLYKGQLELVRKAAEKNKNVIVLALRNPYDLSELPESVYGIAIYEYTVDSLRVITEILGKTLIPQGVLPVQL